MTQHNDKQQQKNGERSNCNTETTSAQAKPHSEQTKEQRHSRIKAGTKRVLQRASASAEDRPRVLFLNDEPNALKHPHDGAMD